MQNVERLFVVVKCDMIRMRLTPTSVSPKIRSGKGSRKHLIDVLLDDGIVKARACRVERNDFCSFRERPPCRFWVAPGRMKNGMLRSHRIVCTVLNVLDRVCTPCRVKRPHDRFDPFVVAADLRRALFISRCHLSLCTRSIKQEPRELHDCLVSSGSSHQNRHRWLVSASGRLLAHLVQ